jgi:hypothetical protein
MIPLVGISSVLQVGNAQTMTWEVAGGAGFGTGGVPHLAIRHNAPGLTIAFVAL